GRIIPALRRIDPGAFTMSPFPPARFAVAVLFAVVIGATAVPALLAGAPADPGSPLARRFAEGVAALAADEMEGRGLGTAGLGKAAAWIEARLRAAGLRPAFGPSYRQGFEVK